MATERVYDGHGRLLWEEEVEQVRVRPERLGLADMNPLDVVEEAEDWLCFVYGVTAEDIVESVVRPQVGGSSYLVELRFCREYTLAGVGIELRAS